MEDGGRIGRVSIVTVWKIWPQATVMMVLETRTGGWAEIGPRSRHKSNDVIAKSQDRSRDSRPSADL